MPFEIPAPEDVRRWRQALGMTQAELARRAGVSQPLIARIERGGVDPRMSTLRSILRALAQAERTEVKVKEIMSSPVVSVRTTDSVMKAIEIMRHNEFSQVPVVNKGTPVGSLSERQVVQRLHEARSPDELARCLVQEIMGPAFPNADCDASLDTVYGTLEGNPAVLVMERGRLVGMLTKSDLLRLVGRRAPPRAPRPIP